MQGGGWRAKKKIINNSATSTSTHSLKLRWPHSITDNSTKKRCGDIDWSPISVYWEKKTRRCVICLSFVEPFIGTSWSSFCLWFSSTKNRLWTMILWLNSTYDSQSSFRSFVIKFSCSGCLLLYFMNIYFVLFNLIYPRLHRRTTIEWWWWWWSRHIHKLMSIVRRYKYTEASTKLT